MGKILPLRRIYENRLTVEAFSRSVVRNALRLVGPKPQDSKEFKAFALAKPSFKMHSSFAPESTGFSIYTYGEALAAVNGQALSGEIKSLFSHDWLRVLRNSVFTPKKTISVGDWVFSPDLSVSGYYEAIVVKAEEGLDPIVAVAVNGSVELATVQRAFLLRKEVFSCSVFFLPDVYQGKVESDLFAERSLLSCEPLRDTTGESPSTFIPSLCMSVVRRADTMKRVAPEPEVSIWAS